MPHRLATTIQFRVFFFGIVLVATAVASIRVALAQQPAAEHELAAEGDAETLQIDFNRDIRPILNEHCVACHGGVKQAADLSFVYADQALSVIEPGDPDNSYFIDRVTAEDDEERMPPPEHGRKLNAKEVSLLVQWIEQGAQWGQHWAFAPPRKIEPPADAQDNWSRVRADRFILDQMRKAGLSPNRDALPDHWLRRVTLDLTGLPPTPEEREKFLKATETSGEAAYEDAVDRLMLSPAFGERWASVWLDVVRYADSRGLGLDGRRTVWKYRDWVIKAFNDDMPYDQFTIRQLAGDLLPHPTINDVLATTCSRLTQTNDEGGTDDEQFRVEAIIDRVNTTWQAWQGLSFGCVQCHSHPYDPIRHEEYYRFMAFFNNTADSDLGNDEPTLAVPLDDSQLQAAMDLDEQIQTLWLAEWKSADAEVRKEAFWTPLRNMEASTNNSTQVEVREINGVEEYRTRGTVAKETTVTVEAELPDAMHTLTAIRFTGLPADEQVAAANSEWGFVISQLTAELVPPSADAETVAIDFAFVIADEPNPILDPQKSLDHKSSQGFGAYSRIHYPRTATFLLSRPAAISPGSKIRISIQQNVVETGAFPLVAHRARFAVSDREEFSHWWMDPQHQEARQRLADLREQRKQIQSVNIPVLGERPQNLARPSYVFDRGNYLTKTESVAPGTPGFLPPIATTDAAIDRLALARWIASPGNPLTARVMVNRVWAQLFGVGIVETQEDFGSSGAPPSHPRLLDDLAVRFQSEMAWSVKSLLRELTLSSTYRQSAAITPEKLAADPANRLCSRGPRKRLPAETIRDQALAISGLLNPKQFGPPVYPPIPDGLWKPFDAGDRWNTAAVGDPDRYRRTIYTYTKRSIPYPIMASFDAPSREFCSMRRLPSNTPVQARMTLNDAAFVEASEALAGRMQDHSDDPSQQLRYGFLLATCREPTQAEVNELVRLHDEQLGGADNALSVIASVLLNLDEVLTK